MLVNKYVIIKNILFILLMIVFLSNLLNAQKLSHIEQYGCVPDKETAIKIAEAIWLPIYGEKIYNKRPFQAELINNDTWKVVGTIKDKPNSITVGGVPIIFIRKKDCTIIKVTHTK
jgi:hypothetical protein